MWSDTLQYRKYAGMSLLYNNIVTLSIRYTEGPARDTEYINETRRCYETLQSDLNQGFYFQKY